MKYFISVSLQSDWWQQEEVVEVLFCVFGFLVWARTKWARTVLDFIWRLNATWLVSHSQTVFSKWFFSDPLAFQLCPLTQCYFLHLANTHSTETAAICLFFCQCNPVSTGLWTHIMWWNIQHHRRNLSAVIWGMPPFHEILSLKIVLQTEKKNGTHNTQSGCTGPSGAG